MGKILTYLGKIYEPLAIRFQTGLVVSTHNHSFFYIKILHISSLNSYKSYLNLNTVNQTIDSIINLLIIGDSTYQINNFNKNYRMEFSTIPLFQN